jgi:glycine cleavage system H protein
MSDYPSDLRYTKDHEWLKANDSNWRVGITSFAGKQLGDVVFVELPKVGVSFEKGDAFGTVESVKAVSELYAPVSGKVVAINAEIDGSPELLNNDPYGEGWLIELAPTRKSELNELLSAADYTAYVASEPD